MDNVYSDDLRLRLEAYRLSFDPPLTNAQLARELNCGRTQVSKYLNGHPDFSVTALEATIEDILRREAYRVEQRELPHIDTSVVRQVNAIAETIRKTNDIGMIYGPAGMGKSVAIEIYCRENPSAISLTLHKWAANAHGVERELFNAVETRSYRKSGMSRTGWLIHRLKRSNRILVIDNAHRMTKGGREWLFDFYDAAEIPIVMVGNPEILDAIRENDQQFSRVGIVRDLKLADSAEIAVKMLRQVMPNAEPEIADLAKTIAGQRGHLRTLRKHLLLVPEVLRSCPGDVRTALLAAHTQIISDYQLN